MNKAPMLGLAVLAVALAACGSSGPSAVPATGLPGSPEATATTTSTSVTTTTLSTAAVGQKVLTALNAGSASIAQAKQESGNAEYTAASTAFSNTAQAIQAIDYPAADQGDAKALVAILEKLSLDAQQVIDAPTAATLQNIENDEGTELADSDALRHDLGLPAASSS
jgi:hypothetical protein